jgi:hypothetical protein
MAATVIARWMLTPDLLCPHLLQALGGAVAIMGILLRNQTLG